MAKKRGHAAVSEEDKKKKVSKKGLKQMLGIFRFVLPYKGYFIVGMLFLLLSTAATLSFPYFLGELVNEAAPSGNAQLFKRAQSKVAEQGLVPLSEVEEIEKKLSNKNEIIRQQLAELHKRSEAGQDISQKELQDALRVPVPKANIPVSRINRVALTLAIILILQAIFSYLRIVLFAQVSVRAMADIRRSVYEKIITLPMVFFEKRRVGELTSRLSSDVTQLQSVLSLSLAEFLRQILTLIVGISILLWVSTKLTLFMLVTFPIMIVAAMFFGKFIRKLSKEAQDELADTNTIVEETLQSITIVKAYANESVEANRYGSGLQRMVKLALKAASFRGGLVSFIFVAIFGGIILVIWRGALLINTGELEVGDLVSFILYTTFIGGSVAGMGNLYGELQKTIGASERIRDILDEEPEFRLKEETDTASTIADMQGDIVFENIHFSYPTREDVEVLKGINLNVNSGQKVALVGQSGAGKSTIAQLLLRFYKIEQGRIKVDGKPLRDYDFQDYRHHIGLVPQEVILFGGTIRENIAYGRPGATDEEIKQAAGRANALDFVERFPEGFETVVGDRGIKLSGGQRQRIAIARAILKDPAILILDEATSSLDAESESLVQSALNELMRGRTTLIIAHRLSTIRDVDCIYVLDNGSIIESGTHQELSEQKGAYHKLLELQMS